ncbi:outer membrane beta-barrel protein [Hymenobacter rigui]|uniref:Outer membrane protein beta-barrel domain-containing protein n=1 Tax=Hymenobacter rigui TaxID=334424 RepID=A0A428KTS2_9BACT|nr:outer membrane beta-barrel protein [Hymenobacter rigui]RSK49927.1 hypothetical protein EI291_04575 [Hymenobacter rigui]
MFSRSISIGAALLTTPLLGLAQTITPEAPRYYVGLSAFTSSNQRQSREIDASKWPPLQLTLGYQLRPRLAVQVSAAYSNSPGSRTANFVDIYGGSAGKYHVDYRNTALSITALGRYTLTRTLSHRFQLDALGGFTLDRATYQSEGFYPASGNPNESIPFRRASDVNQYSLSVGPSLRYRLVGGLEAMAEGTVNMDLRSPRVVTTSGAAGVRYRFGH